MMLMLVAVSVRAAIERVVMAPLLLSLLRAETWATVAASLTVRLVML
jgi:hypothetical protein